MRSTQAIAMRRSWTRRLRAKCGSDADRTGAPSPGLRPASAAQGCANAAGAWMRWSGSPEGEAKVESLGLEGQGDPLSLEGEG